MPHGFDPDRDGNPFSKPENGWDLLRSYKPPGDSHDGTVNGYARNGAHDLKTVNHDSRSYKDRDAVKTPEAVPLFGFEKPDPLRWHVAGLIPEGHVSILAADGGTGKSFLAVYLALRICTGQPFFGLRTERGRVLYVDYELDADEQKRRVWRVAEGMELSVDDERLQERLHYFRPSAPLGTKQAHREVLYLVERLDIDMVIVDSLTVGSAGADVTAADDTVPTMQRLREWGTVLAIDHVSSNAARGNQSRATPFGSVFKRNMARSTLTLANADGGGYLLKPDKSNFTAKQDLVCYAVEFDGTNGPVRFEQVQQTDERMAGSLGNMSTDVSFAAIECQYEETGQPVTPSQIAQWREDHDAPHIANGTAQNHITTLKRRGKVERKGGGAVPAGVAYVADEKHDLLLGQPAQTPDGKGVFKESSDGRFFVQMSDDPNDVHGFAPDEVNPLDEAPF